MTPKGSPDLVLRQVQELQERYGDLSCVSDEARPFVVKGTLAFSAQYVGVSVQDEYEVAIIIPEDYPDTPPVVKETGGRIPKHFHLNPDGTLCLGTPLEVKRKFGEEHSLLGFVENLLIPFLYSHSFKQEYGEMPFGELSHGIEGILESYEEVFGVNDDFAVLGFLRILADDNYRGHMPCPCGSDAKLRNCHGRLLVELKETQNQKQYLGECLAVANLMIKRGQEIPKSLIPKSFLKRVKKTSTKKRAKRHKT